MEFDFDAVTDPQGSILGALPFVQQPETFASPDCPWKDRAVQAYTRDERKRAIERFHEKKKRFTGKTKVRYACRKKFADSRIRIGGRFVSKKEQERLRLEELTPTVGPAPVPVAHKKAIIPLNLGGSTKRSAPIAINGKGPKAMEMDDDPPVDLVGSPDSVSSIPMNIKKGPPAPNVNRRLSAEWQQEVRAVVMSAAIATASSMNSSTQALVPGQGPLSSSTSFSSVTAR
jgi:hypothetical protein